jgi:photosystem II stability/assembly factor-like uncharacterized protein
LTCICFVSPEVGWAVGVDQEDNGLLLKTTDAGETWVVSDQRNQVPMAIAFGILRPVDGWATPPVGDDEALAGQA